MLNQKTSEPLLSNNPKIVEGAMFLRSIVEYARQEGTLVERDIEPEE